MYKFRTYSSFAFEITMFNSTNNVIKSTIIMNFIRHDTTFIQFYEVHMRQGWWSCLIGHVYPSIHCFCGLNLSFHIIIVGISDSCCVIIGHAVLNILFDCRGNVNFSRTIIKQKKENLSIVVLYPLFYW